MEKFVDHYQYMERSIQEQWPTCAMLESMRSR